MNNKYSIMGNSFQKSSQSEILKIVVIYSIFGGLWVYLSDTFLGLIIHNSIVISQLSMYKGLVFIVLTAILLYFLIARYSKRINNYTLELSQIQQILAHQKSLLDIVVEGTTDAVYIKDTEGRYLLANTAVANFVKKPIEEIIGKDDRNLFPIAEAEIIMVQDQWVMSQSTPQTYEERLTTPDGNRYFLSTKGPVLDTDGTVTGLFGIARDITDRKLVEEKLQHASDEWRATFDSIPDMITIVDNEHRIVRANKAAWQKHGCEKQDLIGKACYSVFHGLDYPPDYCPHTQLLQDGLAYSEEIFEPRLNSYLDITVTPLCDTIGNMTGSIHVAHDITGLKQVSEALLERETLYSSILNASPDTIAITDLNGRIRMLSPAGLTMFGYESDKKLIGRAVVDFIVSKDRQRAIDNITLMFQGTFTGPGEYGALQADGRQITIEANGDFIKGKEGKPESMIFVIRDISERKHIEDELNRKNAEIEQFIYTVSHDLRSPLVTVKTFLGFLGQDITEGNSDRIEKDMEYMQTATDRMTALLNELLDMSRVGRGTSLHEKITFQELVSDALNSVAGQISTGKVNVHVSSTDLTLYGDRRRLLQIWQNLLDNAIKYMGDQVFPHIEIDIKEKNGETTFIVCDNGIGIPYEYHNKVFGIFEKLDLSTGGVGMGLTMVKRIVEMYGGQIQVESEGVGTGACFFFTLPNALMNN